jgi:hypothetical protein
LRRILWSKRTEGHRGSDDELSSNCPYQADTDHFGSHPHTSPLIRCLRIKHPVSSEEANINSNSRKYLRKSKITAQSYVQPRSCQGDLILGKLTRIAEAWLSDYTLRPVQRRHPALLTWVSDRKSGYIPSVRRQGPHPSEKPDEIREQAHQGSH